MSDSELQGLGYTGGGGVLHPEQKSTMPPGPRLSIRGTVSLLRPCCHFQWRRERQTLTTGKLCADPSACGAQTVPCHLGTFCLCVLVCPKAQRGREGSLASGLPGRRWEAGVVEGASAQGGSPGTTVWLLGAAGGTQLTESSLSAGSASCLAYELIEPLNQPRQMDYGHLRWSKVQTEEQRRHGSVRIHTASK